MTVRTKYRGFKKIAEDLDYVMEIFKEVLSEIGEKEIADKLPWIGNQSNDQHISYNSSYVQAASLCFQLLNMVEENVANQVRRQIETEKGLTGWRGLWASHLKNLKDEGVTEEEILEKLAQTRIEPVLTAHPTEAKRVSVLEQHRELYLTLVLNENSMWTPSELNNFREKLKTIIERLWRTGEIYLVKPTVESERAALQHYLQKIFPESIGRLDRRLRDAWADCGFDPKKLENPRNFPKMRFGTWVGGDRDGHPFVTPEVTERSLLEYRLRAIELMREGLEQLRSGMTMSDALQEVPECLMKGLAAQWEKIGSKAQEIADRNPSEPWRQFITAMIERLPIVTHQESSISAQLSTSIYYSYRYAFELLEDLEVFRQSLIEIGATQIVKVNVDPVIRQCETFGFHLVKLDMRQNSDYHDKAIEQICQISGMEDWHFKEWPEEKRVAFLEKELDGNVQRVSPLDKLEEEASKVLGAFRVFARHHDRYGSNGLGGLILSMTRSYSDLLSLFFLAKESGLLFNTEKGPICPLPVVPLFETVGDLQNAPGIMKKFMAYPMTRRSYQFQRERLIVTAEGKKSESLSIHRNQSFIQQVMIGYSDSNKDQGIISSQWALHKAQKEIVKIGEESEVTIRFFHGKGGTISRGAGPTDRFLEASPEGSLKADVRLTEQGETISQKYSNLVTATYNLEMLTAGVFRYSVKRSRTPLEDSLDTIIDALSINSSEKYRSFLLKERFMEFYRQATPIDVLENSRIGSRPSRRTGAATLDDLRAIPWVFSWSQSRFFIPGWYGAGSALHQLKLQDKQSFEKLVAEVPKSPFLCYVFTNIEASVCSAHKEVMQSFGSLVQDDNLREEFMGDIMSEYELTQSLITEVLGKTVDERRPFFSYTVEKRNEPLLGIHKHQIELIKVWRSHRDQGNEQAAAELLPEILLSINAVAGGLKTTG